RRQGKTGQHRFVLRRDARCSTAPRSEIAMYARSEQSAAPTPTPARSRATPTRTPTMSLARSSRTPIDSAARRRGDRIRCQLLRCSFGRLEVQDHLKCCRELNGQLRRLRAAQNAIDIGGGATPKVYSVDSVGKQTATAITLKWRLQTNCMVGITVLT